MMYKTHIKIGQTLYIGSIPLLTKAGLMPNIVEALKSGDSNSIALGAVAFGASALVGFHGASWGSGYPDIDHPSSTPARKNPMLSKIFQACGVKHRGKFSHSMDSVTLVFLLMYLAVAGIFKSVDLPGVVGTVTGLVESILKIWIVSAYVGAMSHLIADSLTKQGIKVLFFLPHMKLVGTKTNIGIISAVVLVFTGVLPNVFGKGMEVLDIVYAIVGMVIAFLFSGIVYNIVNKKNMKGLKIIGTIVFGAGLAYNLIIGIGGIEKFKIISEFIRVLLVSGFITSAMPGLDFFKTGDDSTWEKLVRGLFNILLPVSYVVVPLIMFVKM